MYSTEVDDDDEKDDNDWDVNGLDFIGIRHAE